jgi:hypothetical protein
MKSFFYLLCSLALLAGCQTQPSALTHSDPVDARINSLDAMGVIGVYDIDGREIVAGRQDNTEAELALATTLSLGTQDITLGAVVEFVRVGAEVNVVPNWQALELVGIDKDTKITLHTKDVTARTMLELALEQASADAFDNDKATLSMDGGVVRISTIRALNRHTLTRVYDIGWFTKPNNALAQQLYRDHPEAAKLLRFVWKPENPLSRRIEEGGSFCAMCNAVTKPDGTIDCHSYQTRIDQLRDLIHVTVGDPDEWLDEESTIVDLDRQFIIKTTRANHDAILTLMRTMRLAEIEAFEAQARTIEAAMLLKQAEAHRFKQEDKAALRLIERALRVSPGHPEAIALRSIVMEAMQD